jgi:hypothetical protein
MPAAQASSSCTPPHLGIGLVAAEAGGLLLLAGHGLRLEAAGRQHKVLVSAHVPAAAAGRRLCPGIRVQPGAVLL